MSYLKEDTDPQSAGLALNEQPTQIWYGVVANDPVDVDDSAYVILPDMEPDLRIGPCTWRGASMPKRGDKCLVMYDNRAQPWIAVYESLSTGGGSTSGTAGGDLSGTYPNPVVERSSAATFDVNQIVFGGDTNLYRYNADVLRTDDGFLANYVQAAVGTSKQVEIGVDRIGGGQAAITFGSALDTNLYRQGVDSLMTDDNLIVAKTLATNYGQPGQVFFPPYANATIEFSPSRDTSLYRFAANFLATPGNFAANAQAVGQITLQSQSGTPTIFFGSAQDVQLYRSQAGWLSANNFATGNLQTSGWIIGGSDLYMRNNSAHIFFGVSDDITLQRDGAGILGTPGWLRLGANTAQEGIRFYDPNSNGYGAIWRDNVAGRLNLQGQTDIRLRPQGAPGKVWFSDQTGVEDTNLYRSSADNLNTDDTMWALQFVSSGGNVYFGSQLDTRLYRQGSNVLQTGGQFEALGDIRSTQDVRSRTGAASQITLSQDASGYGIIYWGSAFDTSLYRVAAGDLRTNSTLTLGNAVRAATEVIARYGSATQIQMGYYSGYPGIVFGDTADVTLYRSAANVLKTDDTFHIAPGQTLALNNSGNAQAEFAWSGSLRQYRHWIGSAHNGSAAVGNSLDFYVWTPAAGTPDSLASLRALSLQGDGSLLIGTGADTNLYRSGPSQLRTNASLVVDGLVTPASLGSGTRDGTKYLRDDGTWQIATFAVPARLGSVAATVTDWNSADQNGWYMANGAANAAPTSSGWLIGIVTVHNQVPGYVTQEVWDFTDGASFGPPHYTRSKINGTWGSWNGNIRFAGRIQSGAPATGGIWVDGTAGNQFVGSYNTSAVGFVVAGSWRFTVGDGGSQIIRHGTVTPLNCWLYNFQGDDTAIGPGNLYGQQSIVAGLGGVVGNIHIRGPGNPSLYFAPDDSARLYYYSSNVLATPGLLRVDGQGSSSGWTGLLLNPNGVGARWVQVHNPDTGGAGYRLLIVQN